MSDPESFAARWSRRKRVAAKEQEEAASAQPPPQSVEAAPGGDTSGDAQAASDRTDKPSEAPFDPKSLPPIDSITAGSDIKAFLQAGVPKDLAQAALRRAWTADPAIRDFIGLAENQWDFTDPSAMPGFGPLYATDDVRQLLAQAMGRLIEPTKVQDAEQVALASRGAQVSDEAPREPPAALQTGNNMPIEKARLHEEGVPEGHEHSAEVGDTQYAGETDGIKDRRTHGGALPK
jgi:hypothetical protein